MSRLNPNDAKNTFPEWNGSMQSRHRKFLQYMGSFASAATLIGFGAPTLAEPLNVGGNVRVQVAPMSLKALRDQNLVRQALDYSCGAAALATLMTFGLGDAVTEGQILDGLFAQLTSGQAIERQKDGFSLLDMQRVAQQRGYKAQGFRVSAQDLPQLIGPVIVFYQPQGYKHFAVLRGVRGDRVFLADPSRGNIRMPAYQFLQDWLGADGTGVIFVVEPLQGGDASIAANALGIPLGTSSQPEIMSARELLAVGAAPAHTFRLSR